MNDPTLTFKTRRKHPLLLLTCAVILINNVSSMAMPISCPEPCECYLNYNGIQSARCSEIYQNQTAFPNIHVLVLRMSESESQCHIPKDIHVILPQLNFVYMMNCSLTEIPIDSLDNLHHLQEIDISNNYIKKLDPLVFVKNTKLSYANLQNNPFHVPDRPFLISKSIRELDLASCGIKEIPENMFKNLTNLKHLFLNDNKLSTIEENTLPSSVRVLSLSRNSIRNIPGSELMRLKKIRQIDFSENPVNCTCSLMNLQEYLNGKAIMFTNDIDCRYPREYRGYKLSKLPEKELCDDKIAAEVGPDDDHDDDDDDAAQSNQIIIEEESPKKKDNVQDDFERDEVVPVDKQYKPDDTEHYQSDSFSNEGSGDGESQTDIPEDTVDIKANVEEAKKNNSNNNESNETSPDGTNQAPPIGEKSSEPESTPEPAVNENKNNVTSYEKELPSTSTEDDTDKNDKPEDITTKPEIIGSQKNTESSSVSSVSESQTPITGDDTSSEEHPSETEKSPVSDHTSESSSISSNSEDHTQPAGNSDTEQHPSSTSTSSSDTSTETKPNESENSATTTPTSPSVEPASNSNHSLAGDHKTSSDVSVVPPAQLQTDNSDSLFNLGYIIPCLAIIIVIIICLGIYLGQRSSHKNWEPNNTNGNDGAELQDVSLLPDRSKMPIVKNKKYPSEGNNEQTERLMNEGDDPSAPKSVWEHLEEPIENGNSNHTKDSDKLPNGHTIDKNEPIECAVAKVTTLPDSVPRTPIIRNT